MLRERRRHANFKPNRKLDRKSSRGMIYENEELRLRTININAEVEQGQSDIRKLRRENDQLRKEIWSLRDEYDRLDKLLHRRCVTTSQEGDQDDFESETDDDRKCSSCNDSDDSCNSCDTCDNIVEKLVTPAAIPPSSKCPTREKLHVNFDHLSIVSEENLTNSDGTNSPRTAGDPKQLPSATVNKSDDSLTDFQSMVPPLSHFENLNYESIGPNVDSMGELTYSESTGETVIAKEWDFSATKPVRSFFGPIQSIPFRSTNCPTPSGPDLFVSNALATSASTTSLPQMRQQSMDEPAKKFQTGGNLDDLLQDIEAMSRELQQQIDEDQSRYGRIPAKELSTFGRGKLGNRTRPYRSEINLILSVDGTGSTTIPKIIKIDPDRSTDSSSPSVPPPMPLFAPLPYLERPSTPIVPPRLPVTLAPIPDNGNLATVRQRFYQRKVQPQNEASNSSDHSLTTPNGRIVPIRINDDTIKSKARRVSIYFNGLKRWDDKKSKAVEEASVNSIDAATAVNTVTNAGSVARHSSTASSTGSTHRLKHIGRPSPIRKMSHDSIGIAALRTRKTRRHSDSGTIVRVTDDDRTIDRHSQSLGSSRESSTSLSMRSQSKSRKISIGSHNGGKIPWCGCWGNGCL